MLRNLRVKKKTSNLEDHQNIIVNFIQKDKVYFSRSIFTVVMIFRGEGERGGWGRGRWEVVENMILEVIFHCFHSSDD